MWHHINNVPDVPTDRDLRLAVIDREGVHELTFPYRRVGLTWVASSSRKPVVIYPSHRQEWCDEPQNGTA